MKSSSKFNFQSFAVFLVLISFFLVNNTLASNRDFYEIKIFRIKDNIQEARLDKYLKEAYIPALHRAGISKVGVFKPHEDDNSPEKILVVFIPYTSLTQFEEIPRMLEKDLNYQSDGADYINAKYNNPPYERIESTLLRAFSHMPEYSVPEYTTSKRERIYELRSYEGATEKIYMKKVEMFNEGGEIELFERLGFNAVFYGEVISGSSMPNLMYMTTYSDKNSHEEKWNTFRNHPDWKILSGMEEYKNTVSRIVKYILYPTDYSDM